MAEVKSIACLSIFSELLYLMATSILPYGFRKEIAGIKQFDLFYFHKSLKVIDKKKRVNYPLLINYELGLSLYSHFIK